MLTEDDRNRIFEEEKFRLQIRQDLEKENSPRQNRLIAFLNTSLGIFLLSSVLLSGLTWGSTWYQNRLSHRHENRLLASKLKAEINARISIINSYKKNGGTAKDYLQVLPCFFGSDKAGEFNTFDEFKENTIYSLVYQYDIINDSAQNVIDRDLEDMRNNFAMSNNLYTRAQIVSIADAMASKYDDLMFNKSENYFARIDSTSVKSIIKEFNQAIIK
jgi:hypothetical protein